MGGAGREVVVVAAWGDEEGEGRAGVAVKVCRKIGTNRCCSGWASVVSRTNDGREKP